MDLKFKYPNICLIHFKQLCMIIMGFKWQNINIFVIIAMIEHLFYVIWMCVCLESNWWWGLYRNDQKRGFQNEFCLNPWFCQIIDDAILWVHNSYIYASIEDIFLKTSYPFTRAFHHHITCSIQRLFVNCFLNFNGQESNC